eukprot:SAG22_NODE_298_length_12785_cov_5.760129_14_plen_213_part_00
MYYNIYDCTVVSSVSRVNTVPYMYTHTDSKLLPRRNCGAKVAAVAALPPAQAAGRGAAARRGPAGGRRPRAGGGTGAARARAPTMRRDQRINVRVHRVVLKRLAQHHPPPAATLGEEPCRRPLWQRLGPERQLVLVVADNVGVEDPKATHAVDHPICQLPAPRHRAQAAGETGRLIRGCDRLLAAQDKTRQDKTRQDKTRQDKTRRADGRTC